MCLIHGKMTDEAGDATRPARCPPTYKGDEADWNEWSIVARSYIRRHGAAVPGLLREAEAKEEKVLTENLTEVALKQAGRIMSDLTALCSESALRTIMALEDTDEADNGFEAWRLLARRAQGGRGLRTMGLLQAIMDFDFRGPNYLDRLMVWKGLVREYEKRLPGDEILADDIKRASVQKRPQNF